MTSPKPTLSTLARLLALALAFVPPAFAQSPGGCGGEVSYVSTPRGGEPGCAPASAIVILLDGVQGRMFTDLAGGVEFDLNMNGIVKRMPWLRAESGAV